MERSLSVAWLGSVDYRAALVLQDALVDRRRSGAISDTLLTLEHPHVFTLGRGADQGFIHFLPPDVQVYRVSRGGQVTYHGPGQLIGYPIIQLEGAARDVGKYLKSLEEVLIRTLARAGIEAQRRDGFTGVWVNGRKIASIGVGIRYGRPRIFQRNNALRN
jgi:lipoyl(octanoyl) transferase